ncbi:MAG: hypothetical protein R2939_14770 [Kofleriaceae bacterium]
MIELLEGDPGGRRRRTRRGRGARELDHVGVAGGRGEGGDGQPPTVALAATLAVGHAGAADGLVGVDAELQHAGEVAPAIGGRGRRADGVPPQGGALGRLVGAVGDAAGVPARLVVLPAADVEEHVVVDAAADGRVDRLRIGEAVGRRRVDDERRGVQRLEIPQPAAAAIAGGAGAEHVGPTARRRLGEERHDHVALDGRGQVADHHHLAAGVVQADHQRPDGAVAGDGEREGRRQRRGVGAHRGMERRPGRVGRIEHRAQRHLRGDLDERHLLAGRHHHPRLGVVGVPGAGEHACLDRAIEAHGDGARGERGDRGTGVDAILGGRAAACDHEQEHGPGDEAGGGAGRHDRSLRKHHARAQAAVRARVVDAGATGSPATGA